MTNPYRVLFTGGSLSPAELEELRATGLDVELAPADLDESSLAVALAGKDAYILGGVEHATAAAIAKADRLRVISFFGVGYAGFIDTEAATNRGIVVTNAPGANARAVAEFALALILDSWRRVTHLVNQTRSGHWTTLTTRNLEGKTLGILGLGAIGSKVAAMAAHGLGMRVVYTSRRRKPEVERATGATWMELDDLLRHADVVSLHVSYSRETHGLLDERRLGLLQPGAVLVNLSEAEVVDPAALRSAILAERLAVVAMDGYYIEPVPDPADDPHRLLELPDDRFLITPHIANATQESLATMLELNLASIRNVLAGHDDPFIVNPGFRAHATAPAE